MSATAHSVVEPSETSKRVAGAVVVLYALVSMIPLVWIVMTSFKSPPDSISYPPKIVFQPTIEGYCNLFTTRSRQTADYLAKLPPAALFKPAMPSRNCVATAGSALAFASRSLASSA